jgi:hypothetical protein
MDPLIRTTSFYVKMNPRPATHSEVIVGFSTDTFVSPCELSGAFKCPPPIGVMVPNKIIATGITAQTISGPVVATLSDMKYLTSNERVVTPYALRNTQLEYIPELRDLVTMLQKRVGSLERTVESLRKEVNTLTLEKKMPRDIAGLVISYE